MNISYENYGNKEELIQILVKNNIVIKMLEDGLFEHFAREILRLAFTINNDQWLHLANLLIRYIQTSPYLENNSDAHIALAMLADPETVLQKLFER